MRLCSVGAALAFLLFAVSPLRAEEDDDPTRPVTNFDLRPHFQDNNTSGYSSRTSLVFRANVQWDLEGNWRLAARADYPLTWANAANDGMTGPRQPGRGNALVSGYAADIIDDRWAFAFGAQIVAPASDGAFGNGNWNWVPLLAARYMLPELSDGSFFVPQLRYAKTFAQGFAGRRTDTLQFSPQLKLALPQQWFFILFPATDIRFNCGEKVSGQTGRLFLPLDLEAGRNLNDNTLISLEVSTPLVRDYPVYSLKIESRVSVVL
ncbi:MAG TPA: hypothetical protein VGM26_03780 [Rhizomicrobium sp.]|jgi:hypothetical protein